MLQIDGPRSDEYSMGVVKFAPLKMPGISTESCLNKIRLMSLTAYIGLRVVILIYAAVQCECFLLTRD